MQRIQLSLAGLDFDVGVEGPCDPDHVEARFGRYRAQHGDGPRVRVDIRVVEGWRPPREPAVAYPGAEGEVLGDGRVRFLRAWEEMVWDEAAMRAEVTRAPSRGNHPAMVDATPLDTPLRMLLSHLLPPREGVLLHASGYGDPRGAVAFLAPTRGGKTTTARKLPEAHVLSDDQVAARRVEGAWCASALPFVGEYARPTTPRTAPLRALVLLGKAPAVSLRRVEPARALGRVSRCAVRFVRGGDARDLLALLVDLAARVPVYELALPLEAPVAPVLEELLGCA